MVPILSSRVRFRRPTELPVPGPGQLEHLASRFSCKRGRPSEDTVKRPVAKGTQGAAGSRKLGARPEGNGEKGSGAAAQQQR